jgi:hypothetical protein
VGEQFLLDLMNESLIKYEELRNGMEINKVAKLLPSISFSSKVEVANKDNFELCINTLSKYGTLVETDEDSQTIIAVVGSGISNLNPTAVVIKIIDNTVYAIATAKEGLIKQHSAEKAVKQFFDMLMGA